MLAASSFMTIIEESLYKKNSRICIARSYYSNPWFFDKMGLTMHRDIYTYKDNWCNLSLKTSMLTVGHVDFLSYIKTDPCTEVCVYKVFFSLFQPFWWNLPF